MCQVHASDRYSAWRSCVAPHVSLDKPLSFDAIEPRVLLIMPASSVLPAGQEAPIFPITGSITLQAIVQLGCCAIASRREACEVMDARRQHMKNLVEAVADLHERYKTSLEGGRFLGDCTGEIAADPRHVYLRDRRMLFDESKLPLEAASDVDMEAELRHLCRLLAYVALGRGDGDWELAFRSKPLSLLSSNLEDSHFVEAAHLVRSVCDNSAAQSAPQAPMPPAASPPLLLLLLRHPLFWTLERCGLFLQQFGEKATSVPIPKSGDCNPPNPMYVEFNDFAVGVCVEHQVTNGGDWATLSPVFLRHVGFMLPTVVMKDYTKLKGHASVSYLRHSGTRCELLEHHEAFKAVIGDKAEPYPAHACDPNCAVGKSCKVACGPKCEPLWPFIALIGQMRNALSHAAGWNPSDVDVCADADELRALFRLPAGATISSETVVRFIRAPEGNTKEKTYLERGYFVLLCYLIAKRMESRGSVELKGHFQVVFDLLASM